MAAYKPSIFYDDEVSSSYYNLAYLDRYSCVMQIRGLRESMFQLLSKANSLTEPSIFKRKVINILDMFKLNLIELRSILSSGYSEYEINSILEEDLKALNLLIRRAKRANDMMKFFGEEDSNIQSFVSDFSEIRELIRFVNDHALIAEDRTTKSIYTLLNNELFENVFETNSDGEKANVLVMNINDLEKVMTLKNQVNLYVVENDEDIYHDLCNDSESENICGKIRGTSKDVKISNEVFDALLLKVDVNQKSNFSADKKLVIDTAKLSILNNLQYLKKGGRLMLAMPFSRLTPSFLSYLSKKLDNITIKVIMGDSNDSDYNPLCENAVLLTGEKMIREIDKAEAESVANHLSYTISRGRERLPLLDKIDSYRPKNSVDKVSLFRSEILDDDELLLCMKSSGLINESVNEHVEQKVSDTRPLLPFNMGQIGLVLTSGELNGVVKDENGVPHIIKGRTIKESSSATENNEDGETVERIVTSNKVQINILAANGEYIKIS